jgi:hypothetical protein
MNILERPERYDGEAPPVRKTYGANIRCVV